jgi:hypothetical protein
MFAFEPSDNMTSREIINQARYPSPSLLFSQSKKAAPTLGGWHLGKSHLRNLGVGQKGPGLKNLAYRQSKATAVKDRANMQSD